ncbi:MAG: porin, partial [Bacteroidetes bacterium]|nr:porin [Bacteroidota bacterium]
SFTTAVGASTLKIVHVGNTGADNLGALSADGATSVTSAALTVPMGAYTVSAGVASADGTTERSAGISVSAALGGGTLTVGYSQQTLDESLGDVATAVLTPATYDDQGDVATYTTTAVTDGDLSTDGDSTVLGATYAMSLDADTSMAIGYQSTKDADSDAATQFDATVSRALGGGASVFLELRNLSGDAAQDGSAIAIGSRVSF